MQPLKLEAPQLHPLPQSIRQELTRAFTASGTAARLGKAGLAWSATPPEIPARSADAEAAFRTERPDGVVADVYYGASFQALRQAAAQSAATRTAGGAEQIAQNGAFLVRVIARGPHAALQVAEVASLIAGEE